MSGDMQQALSKAIGKSLQQAFTNMFNHRLRVTPALTVVDPKTQTATLEFFNASDDTVNASLAAGIAPPQAFGAGAQKSAKAGANALLADDSSSTTAPVADSVASDLSLASWIQDLPATIEVAPHEKKSVTVHLKVPSNLKPGEYAAWVVATTDNMGNTVTTKPTETGGVSIKQGAKISFKMGGKDGQAMKLQGGAKLVYRTGQ
jgi:hypothetical protein